MVILLRRLSILYCPYSRSIPKWSNKSAHTDSASAKRLFLFTISLSSVVYSSVYSKLFIASCNRILYDFIPNSAISKFKPKCSQTTSKFTVVYKASSSANSQKRQQMRTASVGGFRMIPAGSSLKVSSTQSNKRLIFSYSS